MGTPVVDAFASYLKGRILAERTAGQYCDCAEDFVAFVARRGWHPDHLPNVVLAQFVDDLVGRRYSARSVRVYLSAVRRFMRYREIHGVPLPQGLIQPSDLPKIVDKVPNALSMQDLSDYFDEMTQLDEPMRTASTMLPLTGLRINELVTLKLKAVGSVHMRFDGRPVTATTLDVVGKGSRPRTLVMLPQGRQAFIDYLNGWRSKMPTDWLWPSPVRQNHVSDRWVREAVSRAEARIGYRITPHTMRRTYITSLWRGGIDVPTIAKMTGHSIATLMRHYLAPTAADLARVVHGKITMGELSDG